MSEPKTILFNSCALFPNTSRRAHMGTRVVCPFHRHTRREGLLQAGEVRDPASDLSAYFFLPDFLPHLRGLDKLLLTVVSATSVMLIRSVWFGGLWVGVMLLCSPRTDMLTCSGKVSC